MVSIRIGLVVDRRLSRFFSCFVVTSMSFPYRELVKSCSSVYTCIQLVGTEVGIRFDQSGRERQNVFSAIERCAILRVKMRWCRFGNHDI